MGLVRRSRARKKLCHAMYFHFETLYNVYIGLGLEPKKGEKRRPAQPEWPWQDRKILRRCMSRSPYKP
ncbi:hypothetical protein PAXRUDRAFT_252611 [Paxillus rubicundulus Ve08.2h10]|uniref:Uncharacterized protein n=1 Tax=Paxillus rubicundulus Ve08.2h10 TaxID=930991 RepID=A0A0D0DXQ2_9AGAM|nr:hypothetical protein PAXRUDRAFT_252611 [Paxillus rubicundulus Ve08.2h10]